MNRVSGRRGAGLVPALGGPCKHRAGGDRGRHRGRVLHDLLYGNCVGQAPPLGRKRVCGFQVCGDHRWSSVSSGLTMIL